MRTIVTLRAETLTPRLTGGRLPDSGYQIELEGSHLYLYAHTDELAALIDRLMDVHAEAVAADAAREALP